MTECIAHVIPTRHRGTCLPDPDIKAIFDPLPSVVIQHLLHPATWRLQVGPAWLSPEVRGALWGLPQ